MSVTTINSYGKISVTDEPEDALVCPPDDTYVPTAVIY